MYWIMKRETTDDGVLHFFYGDWLKPFPTIEAAESAIETKMMHETGEHLARDRQYTTNGHTIVVDDDYLGRTTIEFFVVKMEVCSHVQVS